MQGSIKTVLVVQALICSNILYSAVYPGGSVSNLDRSGVSNQDASDSEQEDWKPRSSAFACPETASALDPKKNGTLFKSQWGEDKALMKWFGKLCNGTYLEMGGLDGKKYSNTFAFHKGLQWKGVLVEASPSNFKQLQQNRPNELATIHAGVCDERRVIHFVAGKTKASGGFLEFASETHKERWFDQKKINQALAVDCKPLTDILKESVGERVYFDFFSLDIEGAEYSALTALDFSIFSFGMVVVESHPTFEMKNMAVQALLESNGYKYFQDLHGSKWYYNQEWSAIYKDLVYAAKD